MIRETSGYFSGGEELDEITEEVSATHLTPNMDSKREAVNAASSSSHWESAIKIYRALKEGRKEILYKVLEGEKALQRQLSKRLSSITQKRKDIYKEKFTLLTSEQKNGMARNHWNLFANGDGSSFNGVDIIELQQQMKELEGDLKRSELRYNVSRDLSQEYTNKHTKKAAPVKLSNEQYIHSLMNNLKKNDLEPRAEDLKTRIQNHHKLLKEYKTARKRDKQVDDSAADKLKLPKLKAKKEKKTRKKSIRIFDRSDVSRPYTFSYFPELTEEEKTKGRRRVLMTRGHTRK